CERWRSPPVAPANPHEPASPRAPPADTRPFVLQPDAAPPPALFESSAGTFVVAPTARRRRSDCAPSNRSAPADNGCSEEAELRVIILRGDGVELVIVTAGAGHGQAEERLGQHIDLVVEAVGLILANVHRRMHFFAEEPEAGGEDRFVKSLLRMP